MRIAAENGAAPYDVPGVELGHHGDQRSFDAFIAKYAIKDAALDKLALIVRAADTGAPELADEAAGLLAISRGLSMNFEDDHQMLARFNRGTDTSTVLTGVDSTTKSHGNFKRAVSWPHESGFRYVFHGKDDKNRELTLTVLVFHVPK